MTRRKRLRRVLILCCHCLRNLSYHRAGWSKGALILQNDFWTTVNGNFMDNCVLEWCKLFADQWGKHFWGKVVSNPDTFRQELFQELNVSEQDFLAYVREVREYRDKFVAHRTQMKSCVLRYWTSLRKVFRASMTSSLLMKMRATIFLMHPLSQQLSS